jgi:phosphatidylglycerophosphate synthase
MANATAAMLVLLGVALALQALLGLGADFVYKTAVAFALTGIVAALLAQRHRPAEPFGCANQVTLGRAALVALLAAAIGESGGAALAWWVIALALGALLLDGLDGKLARSHGTASAYGARFDMETDALLILVLTVLAWNLGKAGPWIVAGGLLRYGFLAAGYLFDWLRRPLPHSRRRQTICVVQIVSLLVCLAPFVPPPLSDGAALVGLVALTGSFAIDIAWLAPRRR